MVQFITRLAPRLMTRREIEELRGEANNLGPDFLVGIPCVIHNKDGESVGIYQRFFTMELWHELHLAGLCVEDILHQDADLRDSLANMPRERLLTFMEIVDQHGYCCDEHQGEGDGERCFAHVRNFKRRLREALALQEAP